ncbi:MAG TPA: thioredoxin family protein [Acidimicrobiales bacterium]|nr:thioredoxin family protein [Acidimicrobiales bacterium]
MARHGPSEVRLVYFEDCPNWKVAKANLAAALLDLGADPGDVIYEQVTTAEQAAAVGFRGSPTILVDGVDPFAQPDDPTGLACRIYRTASGPEAAPTVEQLRGVLDR